MDKKDKLKVLKDWAVLHPEYGIHFEERFSMVQINKPYIFILPAERIVNVERLDYLLSIKFDFGMLTLFDERLQIHFQAFNKFSGL